jgi:hypothetical protein
MSATTGEVRLRNGKTAPKVLIGTTSIALRTLLTEQPIAIYELVMACRDKSHVMFGNNGDAAHRLGLVEHLNSDGTAVIHDCVRDIILSAVTGDGLDMELHSPVAEGGAA